METVVVIFNEDRTKVCLFVRYEINCYKLPATEVSVNHDPAIGAKVVRSHILGDAKVDMVYLKTEASTYNSIMDVGNTKHVYAVTIKEKATLRCGFEWVTLKELPLILVHFDNPSDYGYIMDALTLLNRIDDMLKRI